MDYHIHWYTCCLHGSILTALYTWWYLYFCLFSGIGTSSVYCDRTSNQDTFPYGCHQKGSVIIKSHKSSYWSEAQEMHSWPILILTKADSKQTYPAVACRNVCTYHFVGMFFKHIQTICMSLLLCKSLVLLIRNHSSYVNKYRHWTRRHLQLKQILALKYPTGYVVCCCLKV